MTHEDESVEEQLIAGGRVVVNAQQVAPAAAIGDGLNAIAENNAKNWRAPQKAGFQAEAWHEATFNADGARQGSTVRAQRTTHGAPSDLQIKAEGQVVAEVQVKNCKTVARTTRDISSKKYDGMQKVVPSDQADGVRQLATKRGTDGLGERNYADTGQKAAAQVEHDGVKSKPLKYEEAQSGALGSRMLIGEVGTAAKEGAVSGAVIGSAVSAVSNLRAAVKGEKAPLEAAGAVVKDTGMAVVGGAVSAAATSAVTAGCTRAGLQALSKGGAPGAIASTGIEVGKDLLAWKKGELTGTQVAARGVEHAAGAGGAWGGASAGAALGTVLIPIPGVGTLVGGVVGGMLGNAGTRKAIRGLKRLFSDG